MKNKIMRIVLPDAATTDRTDEKLGPDQPFESISEPSIRNSDCKLNTTELATVLDADQAAEEKLVKICIEKIDILDAATKDGRLYLAAQNIVRDSARYDSIGSVLRGAAAYELKNEKERQFGGAGCRDENGIGFMSAYAEIAKCSGKSPKTVEDDVRIYEIFVMKRLEELKDADEKTIRAKREVLLQELLSLPREFFRISASFHSPKRAIQRAFIRRDEEKALGNTFSAAQFRRELASFCEGEMSDKGAMINKTSIDFGKSNALDNGNGGNGTFSVGDETKPTRRKFVECFLTDDEFDALEIIAKSKRLSNDEVIGRSITKFAEVMQKGGINEQK